MSIQMNQSLSVDCAVFGFNGKSLKVLLIERRYYAPDTRLDKLKLPGAMILDNETLPQAAYRVLEEATGLRDVYLKQMDIFSDPNRVSGEELEWINRYHGIRTERVVTVGYYALVKLDTRTVAYTTAKGAQWVDVDSIQREQGVAHKPAQYYTFNKNAYKKALKAKLKLGFINNWRY